jgi:hypothetical protein
MSALWTAGAIKRERSYLRFSTTHSRQAALAESASAQILTSNPATASL